MRVNTATDFWKRVDIGSVTACWNWMGGRKSTGYGSFMCEGKLWIAHRFAYQTGHGSIPVGVVIRHTCDNRVCCNPSHLLPGTVADNNRDAVDRGQHVTPRGEANGRCVLTDEQVREIRASNESAKGIARRLGVSDRQIGRIRSGEHRAAEAAAKGAKT